MNDNQSKLDQKVIAHNLMVLFGRWWINERKMNFADLVCLLGLPNQHHHAQLVMYVEDFRTTCNVHSGMMSDIILHNAIQLGINAIHRDIKSAESQAFTRYFDDTARLTLTKAGAMLQQFGEGADYSLDKISLDDDGKKVIFPDNTKGSFVEPSSSNYLANNANALAGSTAIDPLVLERNVWLKNWMPGDRSCLLQITTIDNDNLAYCVNTRCDSSGIVMSSGKYYTPNIGVQKLDDKRQCVLFHLNLKVSDVLTTIDSDSFFKGDNMQNVVITDAGKAAELELYEDWRILYTDCPNPVDGHCAMARGKKYVFSDGGWQLLEGGWKLLKGGVRISSVKSLADDIWDLRKALGRVSDESTDADIIAAGRLLSAFAMWWCGNGKTFKDLFELNVYGLRNVVSQFMLKHQSNLSLKGKSHFLMNALNHGMGLCLRNGKSDGADIFSKFFGETAESFSSQQQHGVVAIGGGGTSATSAADAMKNLGSGDIPVTAPVKDPATMILQDFAKWCMIEKNTNSIVLAAMNEGGVSRYLSEFKTARGVSQYGSSLLSDALHNGIAFYKRAPGSDDALEFLSHFEKWICWKGTGNNETMRAIASHEEMHAKLAELGLFDKEFFGASLPTLKNFAQWYANRTRRNNPDKSPVDLLMSCNDKLIRAIVAEHAFKVSLHEAEKEILSNALIPLIDFVRTFSKHPDSQLFLSFFELPTMSIGEFIAVNADARLKEKAAILAGKRRVEDPMNTSSYMHLYKVPAKLQAPPSEVNVQPLAGPPSEALVNSVIEQRGGKATRGITQCYMSFDDAALQTPGPLAKYLVPEKYVFRRDRVIVKPEVVHEVDEGTISKLSGFGIGDGTGAFGHGRIWNKPNKE